MEADTYREKLTLILSSELKGWVTHVKIRGMEIWAGTNQGMIANLRLPLQDDPIMYACNGEIADIVLAPNGVLVSTSTGQLLEINHQGKMRKLPYSLDIQWKIFQYKDGYVFAGRNGTLIHTDFHYSPRWTTKIASPWDIHIQDDRIFSVSTSRKLEMLSLETGEINWSKLSLYPVYACEYHNGKYYIGTTEGSIEVLDQMGHCLDKINTPAVRILQNTSLGLLAGMVDGSVTCFDEHLTERWKFLTGSWVKSICFYSNRIVVGSADHFVYLLGPNGNCMDSYQTGYSVLSVDADQKEVAAGSADGYIYVFKRKHDIIIPNT